MPTTAELIDHLTAHYKPFAADLHDEDIGKTLLGSDVAEAYAAIAQAAADTTIDVVTGWAVEYLDDDGEFRWVDLDTITPEQLDAAVVYAAGEAAALYAALDEVTAKGIALLRLKTAAQSGR